MATRTTMHNFNEMRTDREREREIAGEWVGRRVGSQKEAKNGNRQVASSATPQPPLLLPLHEALSGSGQRQSHNFTYQH